ncbi:MAG: carboxypeptidase regulatory-like domain-containing protein, partial [Thermoplasmatales archaeon]|nr:carboxypeptidase regulatory-like domain-containing protein [Thermoplasmatales archaeon]
TYSYYLGFNISHTTTDASGFYTLQLPANQYLSIFARANLYYTTYSTMNATADDTVWVNISLRYGRVPESSRLCGYITEKNTDKPIENATIMQFWMNGNEDFDVNFTRANSLGYYECDIAYGFIWVISAFAKGYLAFYPDFTNKFWVDWGETIWRNISLQKIPKENSRICGYIKDQETGNAVEDASILISWENEMGMNYENITYSDYDGYYKIGASAGNGSIHIIHPKYYYKEFTNLSIDENTTKWINITLESIEPMYKTYKYTWSKQDGEELIGEDLFASKKAPYEDTFTVNTAKGTVLTNVEVHLNWEDDFTYGLLVKKGLDTLSAEISCNSESISESSEGNGNFTFSFAINDMPADDFVEAKDRAEAEDIINDLIKDKNKATVDTTVIVETGERIWRLFKYIKDNGNGFEITLSYVYYLYSLEEIDSQ